MSVAIIPWKLTIKATVTMRYYQSQARYNNMCFSFLHMIKCISYVYLQYRIMTYIYTQYICHTFCILVYPIVVLSSRWLRNLPSACRREEAPAGSSGHKGRRRGINEFCPPCNLPIFAPGKLIVGRRSGRPIFMGELLVLGSVSDRMISKNCLVYVYVGV